MGLNSEHACIETDIKVILIYKRVNNLDGIYFILLYLWVWSFALEFIAAC